MNNKQNMIYIMFCCCISFSNFNPHKVNSFFESCQKNIGIGENLGSLAYFYIGVGFEFFGKLSVSPPGNLEQVKV
jgi:hypothetical protein